MERDELIDSSIPRILCYVLPYYAANGNLDNDEFTVQKRHIHPNTSKLVSVVRQEVNTGENILCGIFYLLTLNREPSLSLNLYLVELGQKCCQIKGVFKMCRARH